MTRVFVATCEACGFAEERGQLAAAVAEADMHEGKTGHRTRIVESSSENTSGEDTSGRITPRPAGPVETPPETPGPRLQPEPLKEEISIPIVKGRPKDAGKDATGAKPNT